MKRTTQIASICLAGIVLTGSGGISTANHQVQEDQNQNQKEEPAVEENEGSEYELIPATGADTMKVEPEQESSQTVEATTGGGTNSDNSTNGEKAEEGESILAFNFLYYIIQKFKFADVKSQ